METSGADKNTSLFCDFSREIFQKPFSVKVLSERRRPVGPKMLGSIYALVWENLNFSNAMAF